MRIITVMLAMTAGLVANRQALLFSAFWHCKEDSGRPDGGAGSERLHLHEYPFRFRSIGSCTATVWHVIRKTTSPRPPTRLVGSGVLSSRITALHRCDCRSKISSVGYSSLSWNIHRPATSFSQPSPFGQQNQSRVCSMTCDGRRH